MQAVLPKTGSVLLTLLGKSAQTDPAKLLAWSNLATPTLCHLKSPVTLRTWQSFFATFCPTFRSAMLSLLQLSGFWAKTSNTSWGPKNLTINLNRPLLATLGDPS